MKYVEFRDRIEKALRRRSTGLTWAELRTKLDLPHDRPCPSWVSRMEHDIGLRRRKGEVRAYMWALEG